MARNNSILFSVLLVLLIFSMIFVPVYFSSVKIGIILALMSIYFIHQGKLIIRVNREILIWFAIYVFSNSFSVFVGIINSNNITFNHISIYVIQPCLFCWLISVIDDGYYGIVEKTIIISSIIAGCYNIIYFCGVNGVFSFPQWGIIGDMHTNYGGYNMGFIKISPANLNWIIFATSYSIAKLFCMKQDVQDKGLYLITIIIGVVNSIITLRSAFIITILLSPIYIFLFSPQKSKVLKQLVIISVALFLLIIITRKYSLSIINVAISKLKLSFGSDHYTNEYGITDNGFFTRKDQIVDLIHTWAERPIFGWGIGANSLNVVRSDVSGSYEITYLAMLMQQGIVGFGVFIAEIVWILHMGTTVVKEDGHLTIYMLPALVGFVAILIANFTNPYLLSFDRMLMLFFPLIIINIYIDSRRGV